MNIAHAHPACASEVQMHAVQAKISSTYSRLYYPMDDCYKISIHNGHFPSANQITLLLYLCQ